MLINADLSTDAMAQSLLQKRQEASGGSNQASAATPALVNSTAASGLDPLFARRTEAPSSAQDGDLDLQNGTEATRVMNSLMQSMSTQPRLAMAAHANQLAGNVLSLLQSTD
jgi:hypothetical protein